MGNLIIREIQLKDNPQIERVIKQTFFDFGLPLVGTAYEDLETTQMFQSYQGDREVYFVVESEGKVLGGAGLKPLKNYKHEVCEIQKMYFSSALRGQGYGKIIFEKCLKAAKDFGYQKCYLESTPELKAALHIYEQYGFQYLEKPLGSTGHYSCGIWMIKNL
jgi:putative acetyltransferase